MYCKLFIFFFIFICKYAIQPLAAHVFIFDKLSIYLSILFEELRGLNEEAGAQLRIKQIKTTTKTAQTIQHDKKCCGCGFTSG